MTAGPCACPLTSTLGPLLRHHPDTLAQLLAITDEGLLCTVDTWPHDCGGPLALGHIWASADWPAFVEGFASFGCTPHMTRDGRAIIPIAEHDMLWGALVLHSPRTSLAHVAAALEPQVQGLAYIVRTYAGWNLPSQGLRAATQVDD